jgi:pyrroline-5-carboxylate reductase
MTKIAIIGGGNMGGAIARGLLKSQTIEAQNIAISDASQTALEELRKFNSDWKLTTSNIEAVENAEIIIISVKPWYVASVANEIRSKLDFQNQIIVSIAAGVDIQELKKYFDSDAPIFRVIPNTAVEIQESVSTIARENASLEQENKITAIFGALGKTFLVDETNLNAYMSLSSCGIAYAFRYIRAAMEGGVEMGIYPKEAKEVVMQTLKGAVKLLETNQSHPEAEIDKVTTPGGITIKGLNEMEANGFTNAVIKGLKKSNI